MLNLNFKKSILKYNYNLTLHALARCPLLNEEQHRKKPKYYDKLIIESLGQNQW